MKFLTKEWLAGFKRDIELLEAFIKTIDFNWRSYYTIHECYLMDSARHKRVLATYKTRYAKYAQMLEA